MSVPDDILASLAFSGGTGPTYEAPPGLVSGLDTDPPSLGEVCGRVDADPLSAREPRADLGQAGFLARHIDAHGMHCIVVDDEDAPDAVRAGDDRAARDARQRVRGCRRRRPGCGRRAVP